ncbi:probable thiopurine S-methyltransferase [Paramormyrops kingsleyae]|nr:thiopurine S-methyltransferase [Paramormyrops kingsleyae]
MSVQKDRVMAVSEWEERWQTGRIGFHNFHVHKMLQKCIDRVLCGRSGVRFFFPLCGKAVDMKWLADMGHSVVGVEISEMAIKQFFEDHNMTYTEETVPAIPEGKLFKSSDGKISLYQCSLYDFSSSVAGQFGGIWDRGSLVAINPCDRERYASILLSLMDKDCRYLLDTLLYNPELFGGPPFAVSDEDIRTLFGSACEVQLLVSQDAFEEKHKTWGLDYLTEKVHLLTLKSN